MHWTGASPGVNRRLSVYSEVATLTLRQSDVVIDSVRKLLILIRPGLSIGPLSARMPGGIVEYHVAAEEFSGLDSEAALRRRVSSVLLGAFHETVPEGQVDRVTRSIAKSLRGRAPYLFDLFEVRGKDTSERVRVAYRFSESQSSVEVLRGFRDVVATVAAYDGFVSYDLLTTAVSGVVRDEVVRLYDRRRKQVAAVPIG